MIQLQHNPNI